MRRQTIRRQDVRRRRRRLFIRRTCIVLVGLLLVAGLLAGLIALIHNRGVYKKHTVEAGSNALTVANFIKEGYDPAAFTADGLDRVDMAQPGVYPVTLVAGKRRVSCEVTVQDTVPPTATAAKATLFKGVPAPAADTLIQDVKDATKVTATYKDTPNLSNTGSQTVTVRLTDLGGNVTDIPVSVTVVEDTTPPVITGVKDLAVYVNGTVNYRKHITVTDNHDKAPKLAVDSAAVDVSKEGTYTITYTATDGAGNTATATAQVVVSRAVNNDEDKMVAAADLADQVLAVILHDGMTDRQKVTAIYNWARGNIYYRDYSKKDNYKVEAYNALKNRSGDCYSYFAATKMMFEQCGIKNIDVKKVKNYPTDSNHFWSLVSVDGGTTYYHFDATPRVGEGDDFCLVTDAFLDAYSDAHKKCHNRDKSLYPATPAQ